MGWRQVNHFHKRNLFELWAENAVFFVYSLSSCFRLIFPTEPGMQEILMVGLLKDININISMGHPLHITVQRLYGHCLPKTNRHLAKYGFITITSAIFWRDILIMFRWKSSTPVQTTFMNKMKTTKSCQCFHIYKISTYASSSMINDPRLVRILYFHSGANALIGEHLQWRIPLLGDQKNMVVFITLILVVFVK